MRNYRLLFLFFFMMVFEILGAQNTNNIFLNIKDLFNKPIENCHIFINDQIVGLSDERGWAKITFIYQDSFRLSARHLSYLVFDTIMTFPNAEIYLEVGMESKNVIMDEVLILPQKLISDKSQNTLQDMTLIEENILTLSNGGENNILELYNTTGEKLEETQVTDMPMFDKILKGWTAQSYYLCNNNFCQNLNIHSPINENIIINDQIKREYFDQNFGNILIFDQNFVIRHESSNFNSQNDIVLYTLPQYERKVLYTIHDTIHAQNILNNLSKFLSIYYSTIKRDHNGDLENEFIDTGIQKQGKLSTINDLIYFFVSTSQLVYLNAIQSARKEVLADCKISNRDIWIINNENKTLTLLTAPNYENVKSLPLPQSKTPFVFIESNRDIYIGNEADIYKRNDINDHWQKLKLDLPQHGFVKKRCFLDSKYYFLATENTTSINNRIFQGPVLVK